MLNLVVVLRQRVVDAKEFGCGKAAYDTVS
jgi:hypothetical protein